MADGDDRANLLVIGAVAGAAAAVMHGAAVGIHAEDATLARIFIALAIAQASVAVAVLVRPGRPAAAALVLVNLVAAGGWLVTRLTGISWIDGLEVAEAPQPADTIAAALALIAVAVGGMAVAGRLNPAVPGRAIAASALVVGALLVPGLVDATGHDHGDHADDLDHAADADHDDHADAGEGGPDEGVAAPSTATTTDDHDDHDAGRDDPGPDDAGQDDASQDDAGQDDAGHDDAGHEGHGDLIDEVGVDEVVDNHLDEQDDGGHGDVETATVPYDPELPIDLGGVEGVTPQQQAFAENLVAATVRDLPEWADPAVAEAAGFRSIGDGFTGHEHYIQWDWIDDDVWLDPDHPESLVFEPQSDGSRRLVAAMFMLPSGTPLDEVPDWGGALMQWHVHGDLCFTDDPDAPRVAGTKPIGGTCPPPLVDGTMAPMIHVWIRPHECGPFAALDGIAGGQVAAGEAVLCDRAHGSH